MTIQNVLPSKAKHANPSLETGQTYRIIGADAPYTKWVGRYFTFASFPDNSPRLIFLKDTANWGEYELLGVITKYRLEFVQVDLKEA